MKTLRKFIKKLSKVSFFNSKILTSFGFVLTWISTFSSLILIFIKIPSEYQKCFAFIFIATLFFIYLFLWIRANLLTSRTININGTTVNVKIDDIFSQDDLKIIPFNEYFDTKVDEKLIASRTLNGMYLLNFCENIDELDERIQNDTHLINSIKSIDSKRLYGKTISYTLGTIFSDDEYMLLAFSKFDSENRAYLDSFSFFECLLNMWNELDILYADRVINIPLLGSGITRMKNMSLTDQELLELILLSLKLSGKELNTQINIIIHESRKDSINFFELEDL